MAFVERDLVRVDLAGKLRPGVVLRVEEERVLVMFATTQEHSLRPEPIVLTPDSRQGRKMQLTATTRFYGQNVTWAEFGEVRKLSAQCSIEFFLSLRELRETALQLSQEQ